MGIGNVPTFNSFLARWKTRYSEFVIQPYFVSSVNKSYGSKPTKSVLYARCVIRNCLKLQIDCN